MKKLGFDDYVNLTGYYYHKLKTTMSEVPQVKRHSRAELAKAKIAYETATMPKGKNC